MRLRLAFAFLGLAACSGASAPPSDPCATVDDAAERHVASASARGLDDDELAHHRDAVRGSLGPSLSPGCRTAAVTATPPPPPPPLRLGGE